MKGLVPESVRPIITGAKLIAFNKKDGGLRPIAIGETIRRIPAKCIAKQLALSHRDTFCPLNLGFGVSGGAEAAVHAARLYLNSAGQDEVFVKLDFANAFNTVRRDVAAELIAEDIPELLPFYSLCYENPSFLSIGDEVIHSEEGFQQGDPLAVFFYFCLSIHKHLLKIAARFKCGYVDDVSLGGNHGVVLRDLKTLIEGCSAMGLQLNFRKCELTVFNDNEPERDRITSLFNQICPGISTTAPTDLELLGSALGESATTREITNKSENFKKFSAKLQLLHRHDGFFLLKNCFAMPKLLYFLRTCPVFAAADDLHGMDRTLLTTCEEICNVSLLDKSEMVGLPAKMGGLGVQLPSHTALGAFLSSCNKTRPLLQDIFANDTAQALHYYEVATAEWQQSTGSDLPPLGLQHTQKAWQSPLYKTFYDSLASSNASQTLLGNSAPGSGVWLQAFPSTHLGLHLGDREFQVAIGLRVGAPVSSQHTCVCGASADPYGTHALSCAKMKSRHMRHRLANNTIKQALASAEVTSVLEPNGLCLSNGKRPDGQTLLPWSRGKCLVWDFTCVHRKCPTYSSLSRLEGATVAGAAETRKLRTYEELSNRFLVQPVALETNGAVGPLSMKFLKELGKRIVSTSGDKRAASYLRQRLGLCVQMGNAACVIECAAGSAANPD